MTIPYSQGLSCGQRCDSTQRKTIADHQVGRNQLILSPALRASGHHHVPILTLLGRGPHTTSAGFLKLYRCSKENTNLHLNNVVTQRNYLFSSPIISKQNTPFLLYPSRQPVQNSTCDKSSEDNVATHAAHCSSTRKPF